MKIYTVISFECGILDSCKHYKNKKDAVSCLHKIITLDEDGYDELVEDGYYSDGNGYEVHFIVGKVK